jgi:hypothetical protein
VYPSYQQTQLETIDMNKLTLTHKQSTILSEIVKGDLTNIGAASNKIVARTLEAKKLIIIKVDGDKFVVNTTELGVSQYNLMKSSDLPATEEYQATLIDGVEVEVEEITEPEGTRGWLTVKLAGGVIKKCRKSSITEVTRERIIMTDTTEKAPKITHCGDDAALALDGLSLEECYTKTSDIVGVSVKDLTAKYGHLNKGMQRMNLGNRIRGLALLQAKDAEKAERKAAKDKAAAERKAEKNAEKAARDKAAAERKAEKAA